VTANSGRPPPGGKAAPAASAPEGKPDAAVAEAGAAPAAAAAGSPAAARTEGAAAGSGAGGEERAESSDAGGPAAAAAAAPGEEPPLVITEAEVLVAVRADLAAQWAQLRAAAVGNFPAADGSGETVSVAARLKRLATGGWIEGERKGRDRSSSRAARPAAGSSGGGTGAPGATAAGAVAAVQASASSAPAADGQEQQQQPAAAGAPASPWGAPRLEVVEAAVVVEPGGSTPAAAEEGEEQAVEFDARDLPAHAVPVTSMLALAMAVAAAAQWWPLLPQVWWGLTHGYAWETLWQFATAMPDTAATHALQLVGATGDGFQGVGTGKQRP
jgi:ribonuclease E